MGTGRLHAACSIMRISRAEPGSASQLTLSQRLGQHDQPSQGMGTSANNRKSQARTTCLKAITEVIASS